MKPLQPPPEEEWPRHKLLRLFLRSPRPRLPISMRHPMAPNEQLYVRALTSSERRACLEYGEESGHDALRFGSTVVALIAASLWTNKRPAFPSARFITERCTSREVLMLGTPVLAKLNIVSPQYESSDWEQWHYAFRVGAKSKFIGNDAVSLAQCVSDHAGHPERYYNIPRHQLTDGQWMAFRGARTVIDDARKADRKSRAR